MPVTAIAVAFGAFASAILGGWLALRAVRYVGVIIAVGAGIRIGAAFFDLIPEAIDHLGSMDVAMLFIASGFLAFYAVDKVTSLHVGHETAEELDHDTASHQHIGVVGATGMGIHSFLDGIALAAAL
jgi:ZIP family zinc transporter